ncbi:MAG TPA: putative zinc-binding metallopeptidase [Acidobacteriota bacterium]|nr:putative zinc-binding metallopeptidase [Acidobacteriota bacterium]
MATALKFEYNWETERYALLNTRICDLKLSLEETLLYRCIQKLYHELVGKNLLFMPPYYFSCCGDEWGCPDRVPIIGIPFHLADPRLVRIETEMGYTRYDKTDLMLLLRHEAGHAFNYAYRLYKEAEWQDLFGDFKANYPSNFKFKFNPFSKSYVRSLDEPKYYAQAHPDEDFAETFAVWLKPRSNWRDAYKKWPAIRKLEYVDRVMKKLRGKMPFVRLGPLHSPYYEKKYTLIEYYGEELDLFKDNALGIYDEDLKKIFSGMSKQQKGNIPANLLVYRNRRFLTETISRWTGAREKVIVPVLGIFIQRCRELKLVIQGDKECHCLASLSSLGTAIVMNYLHTGRYIPD